MVLYHLVLISDHHVADYTERTVESLPISLSSDEVKEVQRREFHYKAIPVTMKVEFSINRSN